MRLSTGGSGVVFERVRRATSSPVKNQHFPCGRPLCRRIFSLLVSFNASNSIVRKRWADVKRSAAGSKRSAARSKPLEKMLHVTNELRSMAYVEPVSGPLYDLLFCGRKEAKEILSVRLGKVE